MVIAFVDAGRVIVAVSAVGTWLFGQVDADSQSFSPMMSSLVLIPIQFVFFSYPLLILSSLLFLLCVCFPRHHSA